MTRTVRPIVLVGHGGHAREILEVLEACRADNQALAPIGHLVDAAHRSPSDTRHGLPILGGLEWLEKHASQAEVVVAVGAPELRFRLAARARAHGARFATLVHPIATVSRRVSIGEGSVLMAGCRVACDVRLGCHAHLIFNSTVGHDSRLGDFVSVYAGANVCGNVTLEEGVLVGAGAVLVERIRVGEWARIGAGSTVLRSLEANVTAVGSPARVARARQPGWHLSMEP